MVAMATMRRHCRVSRQRHETGLVEHCRFFGERSHGPVAQITLGLPDRNFVGSGARPALLDTHLERQREGGVGRAVRRKNAFGIDTNRGHRRVAAISIHRQVGVGVGGCDGQHLEKGVKHVPGLTAGSTGNATTVKTLLADLVEPGLTQDDKRRFIIDGSKALKSAILTVYGKAALIQRCFTAGA